MKIRKGNLKKMNSDDIKKELEQRGFDSNSFDYLYKYLKDNDLLNRLDEYTKRLLDGEPVQYIIGNVSFYGNIINVNKNVLIPRFETELLVEKTIKLIKKKFDKNIDILDIGTGSGCIAITLDKEISCDVDGVDVSEDALDVARNNNILNETNVNFFMSDIFSNIHKKYDVIISNPPYISYDEEIMDIVYNNEPHAALFAKEKGLYFYDKILSKCLLYLKDNFVIAFEIGYNQGRDIEALAYKYLSDIDVLIEKDYNDRDRFVFISSKY